MELKKCERCGEKVDRGACNQTYTTFTIVRDTDETGTKMQRGYLCETCSLDFELFLLRVREVS